MSAPFNDDATMRAFSVFGPETYAAMFDDDYIAGELPMSVYFSGRVGLEFSLTFLEKLQKLKKFVAYTLRHYS
jgi:hypothetical protein